MGYVFYILNTLYHNSTLSDSGLQPMTFKLKNWSVFITCITSELYESVKFQYCCLFMFQYSAYKHKDSKERPLIVLHTITIVMYPFP
jgi:hypothetical protein